MKPRYFVATVLGIKQVSTFAYNARLKACAVHAYNDTTFGKQHLCRDNRHTWCTSISTGTQQWRSFINYCSSYLILTLDAEITWKHFVISSNGPSCFEKTNLTRELKVFLIVSRQFWVSTIIIIVLNYLQWAPMFEIH